MLAIWLEDGKLRKRDDVAVPRPPPGEALIRVLRAGICNTDLELVRGYYPYRGVLGHEFVGVVEGADEELAGRRVVGEINAVCGQCRACLKDRSNHCERRTVLGIVNRDGAFAQYLTLPRTNLHVVPDGVSTDAATFTEPLAAALRIQQQVQARPDDRVLVLGDGKLGQLIAQALALAGCQLLAVGRHPEKLALLTARGIATGSVSELEPASFDVAVECTGNAEGFGLARRALRPGGTLVIKSTYAGELTLDVSSLVVDEVTVVGSRCGPFAPALRLLREKWVDVEPLISGRFPLSRGIEAFEEARRAGTLKVLLDMETDSG